MMKMIETSLSKSRYENFETSEAVKEGWNDLLADSTMPNIFLTWEWVTTWWKWFGEDKHLRLIIIWDNLKMVGVLPVYIGKSSLFFLRVKTVFFVGDGGPVFPEYLSPIIRQSDVNRVSKIMVEALLEISREYKTIKFSDILVTSQSISHLLSFLDGPLFMKEIEGVRCPFQSLPEDYEIFLAGLNSRRRESVRRKQKKARQKYQIKLECPTNEKSVGDAFRILTEIFKKSKRGQNSNQGFNRKDYFGFHHDVATAFAKKGWLRIYFLWFDAAPVAFIYGYYYNHKFWFYQTAFDLSYNQDSPGTIILQMVFESLIREGAREFDFLRGEENYKYHFAGQERQTTTVTLWNQRGLTYRAFASRNRLSELLRKIWQKKEATKEKS